MAVLLLFPILVVAFSLLAIASSGLRRIHRGHAACGGCGYDVSTLSQATCPECGIALTREAVRVDGDERVIWPRSVAIGRCCSFVVALAPLLLLIPLTFTLIPKVQVVSFDVRFESQSDPPWSLDVSATRSEWLSRSQAPRANRGPRGLPLCVPARGKLRMADGRTAELRVNRSLVWTLEMPHGPPLLAEGLSDPGTLSQWLGAWLALPVAAPAGPTPDTAADTAPDPSTNPLPSISRTPSQAAAAVIASRLQSLIKGAVQAPFGNHTDLTNLAGVPSERVNASADVRFAHITWFLAGAIVLANLYFASRVARRSMLLRRGTNLPPFLAPPAAHP